MNALFQAGELVTPQRWLTADVELQNDASIMSSVGARVTGKLAWGDVGLVIGTHRVGSVYVVGPHGGGWAPEGLFERVSQTPEPDGNL